MTNSNTQLDQAYETLKVDQRAEYIVQVMLHRPEVSNAFNTKMAQELYQVFEALSMEPTKTRAIILTGTGDRAFCAGGDLKQRLDMEDQPWFAQHLVFERMARAILNCPIPIIGAINGAAFGGGCELTAACDFAYASETAKFALTEVTLGIMPGAGGTQTLPRAIGVKRAKELILSGKVFSAQEAHEWGLINAVYPFSELHNAALETAQKIAANAPIAVRQAKSAIMRGVDLPLEEAFRFEIEAYNRTVPTKDRREGIRAFNEKRKPLFKDE